MVFKEESFSLKINIFEEKINNNNNLIILFK